MLEINPFDSPEVKRSILGANYQEPSEVDYEDLGPDDTGSEGLEDFKNIISSAPVIPSSGAIKTIIHDAGAVLKQTQEAKAQQMNQAISEVLTNYNREYQLDLHIDLNNFSRSLVQISDERSLKILQLYVSKLFKGIRPLILISCLSKLTLALDQILAPENLLNPNELTLTDRFLAVDQIMNYIAKLEEMKDEIIIDEDSIELKRLANENGLEYKDTDEEMVADFIRLFKKENGVEEN